MSTSVLSAIVLAAGFSRRMGDENKLLLPFGQHSVLQETLSQVCASNVAEVILVSGFQSTAIVNSLDTSGITIISSKNFHEGMTRSIQQGVRAAANTSKGYMICLGDMPLIQTREYNLLLEAFGEEYRKNPETIILAEFQGRRGQPVTFSAHYQQAILDHREMNGCKTIIENNEGNVFTVEMPGDNICRDIDTPAEYQNALSIKRSS